MKIVEGALLAFSEQVDEMINEVTILRNSGIKKIHCDVMDGLFVPNPAFFGEHSAIINKMGFKISVHLMAVDIDIFVDFFSKQEIDFLTYHCEPLANFKSSKIIQKIKQKNIKCVFSTKQLTLFFDLISLVAMSFCEPRS